MKKRLWFLAPFAGLYALVMEIRNRLFDLGIFSALIPPTSSIGVGNLSVGGTGKSVVVDYLIAQLKTSHNLGVISRGYGRKTRGYLIANPKSTADQIGDEPFQFLQKHPTIRLVVSESRSLAVQNLGVSDPGLTRLIFDDCLQHRWIKPQKMILTTTYQNPYFLDFVLPVGRLRELQKGCRRADVILVTKCPENLSPEVQNDFAKRLQLQPHQKLFFCTIKYATFCHGKKRMLKVQDLKLQDILLITGIANPQSLLDQLAQLNLIFTHLSFPDHHEFTAADIQKIETTAAQKIVLTTEKDYGRLAPKLSNIDQLYYWPIDLGFVTEAQQKAFNGWLNT